MAVAGSWVLFSVQEWLLEYSTLYNFKVCLLGNQGCPGPSVEKLCQQTGGCGISGEPWGYGSRAGHSGQTRNTLEVGPGALSGVSEGREETWRGGLLPWD